VNFSSQEKKMSYCSNCGNIVHEKAVACFLCGVAPRSEKFRSASVVHGMTGLQTTGSQTKFANGLLAILRGVQQYYNGSRGVEMKYFVVERDGHRRLWCVDNNSISMN
jgi:recombinational DNA repair protein RecR